MQVIEAAIENVKLKQQIFADLEKACGSHTILSTNTSTIDISLVRAALLAAKVVLMACILQPANLAGQSVAPQCSSRLCTPAAAARDRHMAT